MKVKSILMNTLPCFIARLEKHSIVGINNREVSPFVKLDGLCRMVFFDDRYDVSINHNDPVDGCLFLDMYDRGNK
jgi:hypothetical protein